MTVKEIIDDLLITPAESAKEPLTLGEAIIGAILLVATIIYLVIF